MRNIIKILLLGFGIVVLIVAMIVFLLSSDHMNAAMSHITVYGDNFEADAGGVDAGDAGDGEFYHGFEEPISRPFSSEIETVNETPLDFGLMPDRSGRAEYEQNAEQMVNEVIALWDLFFEDDNVKKNDPRCDKFESYAESVVDAVIMYQDKPTDIGGQLPKHENVHLLVAQIITLESSIKHDVVGGKGEVGLMQIMPNNRAALAGYHPDKVRNNAKLGILLGVRWLAAMIEECPVVDKFDIGWDDSDWLGPLSVYAGGPNAKRRDGTCKVFQLARDRVRSTLMYRTRIDHQIDMDY